MLRPLKDLTYQELTYRLYSGKPHVWADFEAARELFIRGNQKTLDRAALSKRRMTRSAVGWVRRNEHLILKGIK